MVVIHIVDGCLGNTEKARSSNFFDVGRLALRAQKALTKTSKTYFSCDYVSGRLWKNIFAVKNNSPTSSAAAVAAAYPYGYCKREGNIDIPCF